MKKVSLLGFRNTFASSLIGPMDVFFQAGFLWNVLNGIEPTPYFDVELVSVDGKPIRCLNNVVIEPHRAIDEVDNSDLIVVSCLVNVEKSLTYCSSEVEWLKGHYQRGTEIASVCTGAFLLAETGLLDHKTATTHWGFAGLFQELYPNVVLKPERLITDEGDLYCSGAMNSGVDLAIYLVEKYCGHEIAVQCSKAMVQDLGRVSQAPYSVFQFQKKHQDEAIRAAQQLIEDNFTEPCDIETLSGTVGMSRRTFERRFKKATGDSPNQYLQRARVEIAKRMLEESGQTFDEIAYRTGYENSSYFRKVFKKQTGLLPTEYQQKFSYKKTDLFPAAGNR